MDADDGDGCGKAMLDMAVSTSHMSRSVKTEILH